MERCARERLNVKRVVVREDIAIAPRSDPEDRRGLVGCVPLYKIAGAAAAEGKSLDEIREEKVRSWEEMSVQEHMALYEGQGMDRKEAMKQVAKDRGVSKREIYQMLL